MNSAGADEIGKLFVGGLDWSTTQETLRSYFSQYGEVVDCVIMKDKTTNQSRGFGFVKFKDPNCVGTVLASRPHTLDGRNIDPKPCTPRGMQPERTRPKEGWGMLEPLNAKHLHPYSRAGACRLCLLGSTVQHSCLAADCLHFHMGC